MNKMNAGGTLNATTYSIDTAHSDVSFSVRHLMITQIKGLFTRFEGSMASSYPDFSDARIQVQIDAGSILTNHPDRDQHLRGEDFFAVDRFPFIRFQSSSLLQFNESDFLLNGFLTIRDIREAIQLKVKFHGKSVDQYGAVKYGFELTGEISRKDFGLFWDDLTAVGGIIIADTIYLHMNIQLLKN